MNILGGRTCNLECTQEIVPSRKHEFVGIVKVIFIDPTPENIAYKAWGSGLVTLAYVLMISTVAPIIYFTLTFKWPMSINVHIALCTVGVSCWLFNLL